MSVSMESSIARSEPNATFPIRSLFNRLQDSCFDALAEIRYGLDRLALAAQWDSQETVIEQAVFTDMQRCGCRCCGMHLPRLLRADELDHQERYEGWAVALVRFVAGGNAIRQGSTDVERGRLAVIDSKQAKLRMVES